LILSNVVNAGVARFMPCPVVLLDDFRGPSIFNTSVSSSAPINRPEPFVPEEGVEDADRSPGLRAVADIRIRRIAAVEQVPERNAVPLINAHCE
jgi:hypothetical protein